MREYNVNNGLIYADKGIPCSPRWFCDGRLAFGYDEKGVHRLEYFVPVRNHGNHIIFRRGVFDSFRCSVSKDGLRYAGDYKNTVIYPYGLTSEWTIGDETCYYGIYAAEQSVIFSLNSQSVCEFRMSFYNSTQFVPTNNGEIDGGDWGFCRVWAPWEENNGVLYGGFTDSSDNGAYSLYMAIVSDYAVQFKQSAVNQRIDCVSVCAGLRHFGIIFDTQIDNLTIRAKKLCHDFRSVVQAQQARYQHVQDRMPKLFTGVAALDSFAALAPLYHESLKPIDTKGVVRAKTTRYWVWGWDTMISNLSSLLWGETGYIADMLDYYDSVFDPAVGLPHASCYDNTNSGTPAPVSVEGIYITLLETYASLSGEGETAYLKHYDTVKLMFKRLKATTSRIPGLFTGSSLFPDFPRFLKETHNDISLFNNSVYYPMIRSLETIAATVGDTETAQEARKILCQMEQNFFSWFYNTDYGFMVNSLDADTLRQRHCYNICGYFWDSYYHEELLGMEAEKCIDFVLRNGLSKAGFRAYPLWDDAYDGDVNQLHCTWGAVEEVILRLAKNTGRTEPLDLWVKKLGYWMEHLTCPEGESYQYETDEPELDRWNSESGTWQAYTVRKWYSEIWGVILGLSFDCGGITVSAPYTGYRLDNLHLFGKTIHIHTEGQGSAVSYLEINGQRILGTMKIPYDLLVQSDTATVIVGLGEAQPIYVERATGIQIKNWCCGTELSFCAVTTGTKRIFVNGNVQVFVNGKLQTLCRRSHQTYFELLGKSNEFCKVRIINTNYA